MSDPKRESLLTLLKGAQQRGDNQAVRMIQGNLRTYMDSKATEGPSLQDKATRAMGDVKVDPLAGLRRGGAGPLPEMMRMLDPLTTEQHTKTGPQDWDPYKGVAYLGRGVENLSVGGQQIGNTLAEKIGMLDRDENDRRQQALHGRMASAEEPYNLLKRGQEGTAMVGEIMGETIPFMGVPVARIAAPFTSGIARVANPLVKATPEIGTAATEAMIPYAENEEERLERGQVGGMGGWLAKLGGDFLGRWGNKNREIMNTERLQELHDLGKDFSIPIRNDILPVQREAAGQVAEARTGVRDPGALADNVAQDLSTQVTGRVSDMNRNFDRLMEELDSVKGFPLARDSRGKFLPKGMLDVNPIRGQVEEFLGSEIMKEGMQNPRFVREMEKWRDLPEAVTMQDLNKYRRNMRERMPTDTDSMELWQKMDDFLSDEMATHADRLSPGAGQMLRDMDHWTHSELPRLQQIPAIKQALGNTATPQSVMNWLITNPSRGKQEVADMLTPFGRSAVNEAFWNSAFRAGSRGANFSPLSYAKYIEGNLEGARQFMSEGEITTFTNIGKVMRHISGEGAAPDVSVLKLLRGFPFMYRAVADRIRQANFLYMMRNVPPDIKPGSPAMERWYRGFIRGLAIQEDDSISGPLVEQFGPEEGAAGRMARDTVESLFPPESGGR